MKKKLIIIMHYLILAFAILLPFWMDWKTIAIIMITYHFVFTRGIGYCPLTVWQFGTAEEGFIERNIIALSCLFGFSIPTNRRNLQTFIRYGLPLLLVTAAFVRQVIGL